MDVRGPDRPPPWRLCLRPEHLERLLTCLPPWRRDHRLGQNRLSERGKARTRDWRSPRPEEAGTRPGRLGRWRRLRTPAAERSCGVLRPLELRGRFVLAPTSPATATLACQAESGVRSAKGSISLGSALSPKPVSPSPPYSDPVSTLIALQSAVTSKKSGWMEMMTLQFSVRADTSLPRKACGRSCPVPDGETGENKLKVGELGYRGRRLN
ncbi:uncharacterized protein LOC128772669 [Panthera pardus]|uniref:Uncharacterized protein LOC128772669 n=1 Tax=Panthera pardus TaxID=9691 RepID=A0A9W2UDV7_PANPR|nr:uncharacterized protein LOC128772669 [Panthera pardus]